MSHPHSVSELVERGREAAARGSWREAYDLLVAVNPAELAPEDLELIGEATSWTGPTERCIAARERAYSAYVATGNRRGAARLALALVRDHQLAHAGSVAAGWSKRAERVLEQEPECPEHGHLARRQWLAAYARGDLGEARRQLQRALELAQRFSDRDLEALTLHNQGSILISEGEVEECWALIDEAAAGAAAGDLRPTATGQVYCWTISACRDLMELRRAGEWTTRFEQWCERTALPGGWRGDCRVHRAEFLRLQGRWAEAEEEATSACNDFSDYNTVHGFGTAAYELGELHFRRGNLAAAEDAFRRALEAGVEPQPGLALLRLAEGKPSVGLSELQRALGEVPDDRIERARLLPAYVELAVAAGHVDRARGGAEELASLSALFGSDALTAMATWASGIVLLAEGAAATAVAPLREAVRHWHHLGAPYEAARARTALAEAYQATADDDAAMLELEAARSIFERLGAAAAVRRAAELMQPRRPDAAEATFLFSDICGSTSLTEALGDQAWHDLVEWHDRTLRALFARHRGEEVDHAGDGFFVAFADSAGALACAVEIQRALAEHRRNHGFAPPVRIGVHTAEAIAVRRAFRGKGVHAAARVGAVAEANEIAASRETAEAGRVTFTNPRLVELKGLSEPVEIVSVDWA
ncbi:MAG TPA: adenylate/guanylate cyclase domain-containing protein [Thermoanaerobaculia bacterium]|nr:adenylate/guanylate cyclase domain-containing protein [Thermoanaerobaculia bacterium]